MDPGLFPGYGELDAVAEDIFDEDRKKRPVRDDIRELIGQDQPDVPVPEGGGQLVKGFRQQVAKADLLQDGL